MKELNIEEKAKAYDKAIEKLRSLHDDYDTVSTIIDIKEELKNIFPELKESEDEKIRKALIKYFTLSDDNADYQCCGVHYKDIVAWLEKQGQKPQGKSALEAAKEEKVDNQNCVKTDNVEPKFNFKVCQWIVATGKCVYLITKIDGFNVTLVDTNGDEYVFDVSSLDDAYQWTIQDAKPGDVLYLQKDGKEHIIIYKGVIKERFRTFVSAYCAYNGIVDAFCFADVSRYVDIAYGGIMPATKEQRDTLMKAMADAGYEWDTEKKELKKIEQKPAWSEEDKKMLSNIDGCIKNLPIFYETIKINGEEKTTKQFVYCARNWLKSLKDRVQPKQEWSEEDEAVINKAESWLDTLCDYLKDSSSECISDVKDVINKLKSIKERYTWKPSDEQMKVLSIAMCGVDDPFFSLYQDLKKLMEGKL